MFSLQHGVAPLLVAVQIGNLELIQLLCERGADLSNATETTGMTVLHQARQLAPTLASPATRWRLQII